ncbi:peptidoglycan DD-metalloendopeptidase family protein [Ruminococcaceae bacterium OttesenSCG-928-A16]|nr:peptidoglycan DD-metalloendopeptidase family protein [Ruminococcaceae bacterium OttesenSCG-928-A16]
MQSLRKKNVFISLFFVLLLVFSASPTFLPVFATGESESSKEEYEQKQKEVEEKRAQIAALEKAIKEGKASAEAAAQRKAYYAQEAALLEEQIVLKRQQIATQEQAIEVKIGEVAVKQSQYDDNYQQAVQRLRAMYKMNDANLLSTLLAVDSFSDLLTSSRNIQLLSQNDAEFLSLLESQRIALETEQAELQAMLATLEEENTALANKQAEYSNNVAKAEAERSAIVAEVAQSEEEKEALYQDMVAAQQELETLWKNLGGSSGQYVGGALHWPVPSHNGSGYISSHYGWRTLYGRPDFHTGIDIARGPSASIDGARIEAANSGTVIYVENVPGSKRGYGSYLIIDHGGGVRTYYAHCSSIVVSVGAYVNRGDHIANVGNTGNSTGPHLHFELRVNNTQHVNPYPYLSGQKEL